MRAFYTEKIADLLVGHELELVDEVFQHIKVVRLKNAEEVLLLDGMGTSLKAQLLSMEKKKAIFKIISKSFEEKKESFDLAIGLVKKDAFDLCLKMAAELGVNNIYPVLSHYSQRYEINEARANRLLIQALEQSNSRWLTRLHPIQEFTGLAQSLVENIYNYSQVVLMGMSASALPNQLCDLSGPTLGVIGPEGGFDGDEETKLAKLENGHSIHLPTPILRTPTALAAMAGVIFTKQGLLD